MKNSVYFACFVAVRTQLDYFSGGVLHVFKVFSDKTNLYSFFPGNGNGKQIQLLS